MSDTITIDGREYPVADIKSKVTPKSIPLIGMKVGQVFQNEDGSVYAVLKIAPGRYSLLVVKSAFDSGYDSLELYAWVGQCEERSGELHYDTVWEDMRNPRLLPKYLNIAQTWPSLRDYYAWEALNS